jgi:hypothetical protein
MKRNEKAQFFTRRATLSPHIPAPRSGPGAERDRIVNTVANICEQRSCPAAERTMNLASTVTLIGMLAFLAEAGAKWGLRLPKPCGVLPKLKTSVTNS